MQNITIIYRTQSYPINIDKSKSVLELKKEVSNQTGISQKNFDLQANKIIALSSKEISHYLNDEAIFTMVNVSIDVIVVLNSQNKSFCVNELKKVNDFVKEIILSSGHNTEISLFYNGRELVGTETVLSNGVVHNATLTTKNGIHIVNFIKRVSVTYRNNPYQVDIDERKSVAEFKQVVSGLTSIKVDHFCLQFNRIYLSDQKSISTYTKEGTNFSMVNVSISVYVLVNGKEILFFVKENSKIDDFKKEIIKQAKITCDITLEYYTGNLVGSSTVLESGLRNKCALFAIMDNVIVSGTKELTIENRNMSYRIVINTSRTIYELKEEVAKLLDIRANNFSLHFYWIEFKDGDKISDYMKYGPYIEMWKVTINVIVKLDERNYTFSVAEDMTVDNFLLEIAQRTGKMNIAYLIYNGNSLVRTKTIKDNGVEHNHVVIAMSTVIGG